MSKIPSPKALPNQRVLVKNYRAKDLWEEGVCVSAQYSLSATYDQEASEANGSWGYDVMLDRKSANGRTINLYARNASIKPVGDA